MSTMAPEGGLVGGVVFDSATDQAVGGTTALEVLDLTDVVGDLEVPCEWHRLPFHANAPATWIAYINRCPHCRHNGGVRLVCADCKNGVLLTPEAAVCTYCDGILVPFRKAVSKFEPINRRPAG